MCPYVWTLPSTHVLHSHPQCVTPGGKVTLSSCCHITLGVHLISFLVSLNPSLPLVLQMSPFVVGTGENHAPGYDPMLCLMVCLCGFIFFIEENVLFQFFPPPFLMPPFHSLILHSILFSPFILSSSILLHPSS